MLDEQAIIIDYFIQNRLNIILDRELNLDFHI